MKVKYVVAGGYKLAVGCPDHWPRVETRRASRNDK
jgi:hypothetical protein